MGIGECGKGAAWLTGVADDMDLEPRIQKGGGQGTVRQFGHGENQIGIRWEVDFGLDIDFESLQALQGALDHQVE